MSIKIIVATHKKAKMPVYKSYMPVQVGAALKPNLGYVKDNTGENISDKNPSYSELTGLYWAWKNLNVDYVGLVHYRRYFALRKGNKDPLKNILNDDEINKLIQEYNVIIPQKRHYYIESLYSHYSHTHYKSQLDEVEKIIEAVYPEYLSTYKKVLNRKWGYMFNMMIMKKEYLDSYCNWLFDILFRLEENVNKGQVVNTNNLSKFQGRFYGRISEILFNVWLQQQLNFGYLQKKEIKEVKYIYIGKVDMARKILSFMGATFFHRKYNRSF